MQTLHSGFSALNMSYNGPNIAENGVDSVLEIFFVLLINLSYWLFKELGQGINLLFPLCMLSLYLYRLGLVGLQVTRHLEFFGRWWSLWNRECLHIAIGV